MAETVLNIVVIIGAVGVGGALNWLFRASASKLEGDAARLDAAKIALQRHRKALDTVLESRSADEHIKRVALVVSEGSLHRDVARQIVLWIETGAPVDADDEDSHAFDASVERLRLADADAFAAFVATITTALAWMILQWPETAERVRAFVELASEPTSQVVHSAALFKRAKDDDKTHMGGGMVAATA